MGLDRRELNLAPFRSDPAFQLAGAGTAGATGPGPGTSRGIVPDAGNAGDASTSGMGMGEAGAGP